MVTVLVELLGTSLICMSIFLYMYWFLDRNSELEVLFRDKVKSWLLLSILLWLLFYVILIFWLKFLVEVLNK